MAGRIETLLGQTIKSFTEDGSRITLETESGTKAVFRVMGYDITPGLKDIEKIYKSLHRPIIAFVSQAEMIDDDDLEKEISPFLVGHGFAFWTFCTDTTSECVRLRVTRHGAAGEDIIEYSLFSTVIRMSP